MTELQNSKVLAILVGSLSCEILKVLSENIVKLIDDKLSTRCIVA
jgi:hypothetical protein